MFYHLHQQVRCSTTCSNKSNVLPPAPTSAMFYQLHKQVRCSTNCTNKSDVLPPAPASALFYHLHQQVRCSTTCSAVQQLYTQMWTKQALNLGEAVIQLNDSNQSAIDLLSFHHYVTDDITFRRYLYSCLFIGNDTHLINDLQTPFIQGRELVLKICMTETTTKDDKTVTGRLANHLPRLFATRNKILKFILFAMDQLISSNSTVLPMCLCALFALHCVPVNPAFLTAILNTWLLYNSLFTNLLQWHLIITTLFQS